MFKALLPILAEREGVKCDDALSGEATRARLSLFQRALFERFSQRLLDSDVIAATCRLDVRDEIGGQPEADLFLRRRDGRTPDRPYAFHGLGQLGKCFGDGAQIHIGEVFIGQFADLALFVG